MSEPISCAQALLNSIKPETPHTYADAVDEAIRQCVTQCRPAYIELPMDCVRALVSTEGLQKPLVRWSVANADTSPRPTRHLRWRTSPRAYPMRLSAR